MACGGVVEFRTCPPTPHVTLPLAGSKMCSTSLPRTSGINSLQSRKMDYRGKDRHPASLCAVEFIDSLSVQSSIERRPRLLPQTLSGFLPLTATATILQAPPQLGVVPSASQLEEVRWSIERSGHPSKLRDRFNFRLPSIIN